MSNGVTGWSYSAYELYAQCPAKFKYEKIDKLPTGDPQYFKDGRTAHISLQHYIESRGATQLDARFIKKELAFIEELAQHDAPRLVEQKWAFNAHWYQAPYSGQSYVFRQICDVVVLYPEPAAEVIDWKTGGKYDRGHDQMELSAVGVMKRFPAKEEVTTRLVYVTKGGQEIETFPRRDLEALTAKWNERANRLFTETAWLPRPNDRCGFCDFSKGKGGPCRYG